MSASASGAASACAVTGPRPCKRSRRISTSAASRVQALRYSAGASIFGARCAAGNAASNSGKRSAATYTTDAPSESRVARLAAASSSKSARHCGCASISASLKKPRLSNASCNSSALRASGHTSSRTLRIASASSLPRSAAVSGSIQRRAITACVRRSSSGASSRYAYGRAARISSASGEGSTRSRATTSMSPLSIAASRCSSPSMSIASCRQSSIVCRTSGWSGISRSPTMFSPHASWSGKIDASRSSAAMRCNGGATLRPPRMRSSASATMRVPTPARAEHRRVEQRLHEQRAHRLRRQVARHVFERKTVRRRQRQHDRVLGRRGLQLEIELPAETLAQREPPCAIDAAAERRMHDELHAARFVEETLEHDRAHSGQSTQRRLRRREVVDDLLGGRELECRACR